MINEKSMCEMFQKMYHQDKRTVLSKLGAPDVSYNSFVAYYRSHFWMVLFFKDVRINDSFKSELQSVTFYDDTLRLLWSKGIRLFRNTEEVIGDHPSSVDEFVRKHGIPHSQMGGMSSTLQYLTDDGRLMIVKHHHNQIDGIRSVKLPDLRLLK